LKRIFFLALFLFISVASFAQLGLVRGKISDTLINKSIPFASVTLLDLDSNLLFSQRSPADGSFQFNVQDSTSYILLIAHPKFVTVSFLPK